MMTDVQSQGELSNALLELAIFASIYDWIDQTVRTEQHHRPTLNLVLISFPS